MRCNVDKKEVFDYLRNQQKAAEIDSKVNGVNVWVLAGAIGLITWQLITTFDLRVVTEFSAVISAVFCVYLLYVLAAICSPDPSRFGVVRYSRVSVFGTEPSMLHAIQGLILIAPPALSFLVVERNFATIFIALPGTLILLLSVLSFGGAVLNYEPKNKRFPRPIMQSGRRSSAIITLITTAFIVWLLIRQIQLLTSHSPSIDLMFGKNLILIAALYLLMVFVVERQRLAHALKWSYDLETALLTDEVTPEVAVRRIENRELGRSLSEVMDRFFNEMDEHLADVDRARQSLNEQAESIKAIPREFQIERTSRIEKLALPAKEALKRASEGHKEFTEYLKQLEGRQLAVSKEKSALVLQALVARERANKDRIDACTRELGALTRDLDLG